MINSRESFPKHPSDDSKEIEAGEKTTKYVGAEAWKAAEELLKARPEYVKGDIPFGFDHAFPNSDARLKAFQDEEGIGHVFITKGDEVAFNMEKILPVGYKMVTPTYIRNHELKKEFDYKYGSGWQDIPEHKFINLGDFRSVSMLVALLHEAGHARYDTPEERSAFDDARRAYERSRDPEEKKTAARKMAEIASAQERRASGYALKTIRELKKSLEISDPALSTDHLKQITMAGLFGHRKFHEINMARIDKGGKLQSELNRLFDRGRGEDMFTDKPEPQGQF